MNEELTQINNDIKDLRNRLSILEDRKKRIQSKLSEPDLIGKYICYVDDDLTYYMKVNDVDFSNLAQSYMTMGSSISIIDERPGTRYELNSEDVCILARKYEIIDKEKYDYVLKEAFDKF